MRRPSARLANGGTVERPPLGVKIHETVCRDALDGSGLLELLERRSTNLQYTICLQPFTSAGRSNHGTERRPSSNFRCSWKARFSKPRVQISGESNSLVAGVEGLVIGVEGVGNTVVANGACCASMAG